MTIFVYSGSGVKALQAPRVKVGRIGMKAHYLKWRQIEGGEPGNEEDSSGRFEIADVDGEGCVVAGYTGPDDFEELNGELVTRREARRLANIASNNPNYVSRRYREEGE